jgi:hypothetical protein
MCCRVAFVRADVSEERSASSTRVTRIGELGTTLAVTSNWRLTLFLVHWFLSPWCWRRYVPPKRRFLQEPHDVTFQKTAFFRQNLISLSLLSESVGNTLYIMDCRDELWLTHEKYFDVAVLAFRHLSWVTEEMLVISLMNPVFGAEIWIRNLMNTQQDRRPLEGQYTCVWCGTEDGQRTANVWCSTPRD